MYTGGSILADKMRITKLSQDPLAYIRLSPSSGALGVCLSICTLHVYVCMYVHTYKRCNDTYIDISPYRDTLGSDTVSIHI